MTAWVLMADQILFVAFDVAAGYFADRVHRLCGRIGPWRRCDGDFLPRLSAATVAGVDG